MRSPLLCGCSGVDTPGSGLAALSALTRRAETGSCYDAFTSLAVTSAVPDPTSALPLHMTGSSTYETGSAKEDRPLLSPVYVGLPDLSLDPDWRPLVVH